MTTSNLFSEKSKTKSPLFIFSISQWNACSLCDYSKIDFVRSINSHIVAIQEIRNHQDMLDSCGYCFDFSLRTNQIGGGTSTFESQHKSIQILQRITVNKDTNLLKLCMNGNILWFSNVYLHDSEPKRVQKLFAKIQKFVPDNELSQILLIGDFNIDILKESEK